MRSSRGRIALFFLLALLPAGLSAQSLSQPKTAKQQTSDSFRWIDFHAPQDQNIVTWVARALQVDNWTVIREIGVVYDAALVVTTERSNPQAPPGQGTFTVWSVSLTNHEVTRLISGVNLRWYDRLRFADGTPQEWPVLYDNCQDCQPNTYFTAFYYDLRSHAWGARWLRGGQGVVVWNTDRPGGVQWTQLYAVLPAGQGHVALYTWNHFDHGKNSVPDDFIVRYDLDPFSDVERSAQLTSKQTEGLRLQICSGQDAVQGLERGQDSELCQKMLKEHGTRRPVTTPPANNRGRMGGR